MPTILSHPAAALALRVPRRLAVAASALAVLAVRGDRRAFALLFACAASHGLLDAMTDGGRGVAFFSPFSNRRYFFPWRPIRVSPIAALDARVLWSEAKWVWAPAIAVAVLQLLLRRRRTPCPPGTS